MIYNYINSISSNKTLILSIIILFYVSYSVNFSNLSVKGILGIIISLVFVWYIFDKDKSLIKEHDLKIKKIIKEIPILEPLSNFEELILFYYRNKLLINYDYLNYKKSVLYCIEMTDIYTKIINEDIKNRFLYDILIKKYYQCINNFKNMEYNIHSNNLFNVIEELNLILSKYINEVITKNNEYIDNNGYNIYRKKINNIKAYNNITFNELL